TDAPTTVSINLHIISVSQIDDLKMLYTLDLFFRQEWTDDRLQFSHADIELLTLSDSHMIWVPDIFFPQEYKSYVHDVMESNTFVRINQNGTVFRSARITLILRCPMHFGRFPFDRQVCSLNIESYKWKANDIALQWSEDPVTSTNEILSPLFNFDKYTTHGGLIGTNIGDSIKIVTIRLHI
ncbi:transmembrane ion channel, partial [Oryctes borbonicus]